MAFPMPTEASTPANASGETPATVTPPRAAPRLALTDAPAPAKGRTPSAPADATDPPPEPPGGGRPSLKRVK
jgi:stringent starvation protein B